ncbi:UbiA family prenyltransferase [Novosphingobium aerophilum]|uniref:UbiA family prenyltransferase n=1 Tax=Novosphingobium TaxID=165696 RepID=UPI0006C8BC95|nr:MULTISPECIES: UbiA family prenyltransferase [unclassified Novosphingobium]KPH58865.1 membrane protein [Novosphingobium sp. ST904]TCM37080.1 4-hydroxybenzoate polyprenyltransferase [Novosphingobium sp. ST904]WRT94347.1 UbiA family prenyltransferase [Novosphingobium sp. RL4]
MPSTATLDRKTARLRDYLTLARFDHITKHVFIIPGLILAYALREPSLLDAPQRVVIGFVVAIAIASANYVINEWLDREFDAHHPSKHHRKAVSLQLSPALVYVEYLAFAGVGLSLAAWMGGSFFVFSIVFLASGLVYNVQPIRSKDRPFLDVISESVNNPIRLTLGWLMIDPSSMPPVSLLLAYWTGGAFLMGSKRLSEYRDITAAVGLETLTRYRKSFAGYTAESLVVSCLVYAMLSSFFLGVFLIKYRVEYVLAFPFIAGLFGCYLWLSMLPDSIAQRPERMFRSRRLMATLGVTVSVLLVLSFLDLAGLSTLTNRSFTPADMLPGHRK